MSNVQLKPTVSFSVKIELTENEAKALDALAGYGTDEFLQCFYKGLGKAYLEPFEKDLIALFAKIKELQAPIANINEARKKLGLSYNGH